MLDSRKVFARLIKPAKIASIMGKSRKRCKEVALASLGDERLELLRRQMAECWESVLQDHAIARFVEVQRTAYPDIVLEELQAKTTAQMLSFLVNIFKPPVTDITFKDDLRVESIPHRTGIIKTPQRQLEVTVNGITRLVGTAINNKYNHRLLYLELPKKEIHPVYRMTHLKTTTLERIVPGKADTTALREMLFAALDERIEELHYQMADQWDVVQQDSRMFLAAKELRAARPRSSMRDFQAHGLKFLVRELAGIIPHIVDCKTIRCEEARIECLPREAGRLELGGESHPVVISGMTRIVGRFVLNNRTDIEFWVTPVQDLRYSYWQKS